MVYRDKNSEKQGRGLKALSNIKHKDNVIPYETARRDYQQRQIELKNKEYLSIALQEASWRGLSHGGSLCVYSIDINTNCLIQNQRVRVAIGKEDSAKDFIPSIPPKLIPTTIAHRFFQSNPPTTDPTTEIYIGKLIDGKIYIAAYENLGDPLYKVEAFLHAMISIVKDHTVAA